MKFTEQEILHTSERGMTALVTDENEREYVRKTGRFNAETLSRIAAIESPFIIRMYDYSDVEIVMEYVSGTPLSALAVPASQLYEIICEICDGLSVLHNAGVIHRDIKLSNIMLTDYGHIKIIDFDAARIKKPEAEKDTSFIGTDGFAPPEQYGFTQTDERSDIYALGVTIKLMLKNDYERSPLRAVAEKCMRFNPEERYATAQKVKRAVILRRYRAVPIACAAVVAVAGVALTVTFMLNKTNDVPVSAPVSDTSEQTVGIITDAVTAKTANVLAKTVAVPQTAEITTEQTADIITGVITTDDATTFAEVTTTPQTAEPATDAETAKPEISFLPEGFPALPNGITKVDDSEHIKKIEWEKLSQDDVNTLIDNIIKWLGDSAEVDDKSTRMCRTIQWKCNGESTFNGYIILLYVEDTEKYSAFPQCRLSISIADS